MSVRAKLVDVPSLPVALGFFCLAVCSGCASPAVRAREGVTNRPFADPCIGPGSDVFTVLACRIAHADREDLAALLATEAFSDTGWTGDGRVLRGHWLGRPATLQLGATPGPPSGERIRLELTGPVEELLPVFFSLRSELARVWGSPDVTRYLDGPRTSFDLWRKRAIGVASGDVQLFFGPDDQGGWALRLIRERPSREIEDGREGRALPLEEPVFQPPRQLAAPPVRPAGRCGSLSVLGVWPDDALWSVPFADVPAWVMERGWEPLVRDDPHPTFEGTTRWFRGRLLDREATLAAHALPETGRLQAIEVRPDTSDPALLDELRACLREGLGVPWVAGFGFCESDEEQDLWNLPADLRVSLAYPAAPGGGLPVAVSAFRFPSKEADGP